MKKALLAVSFGTSYGESREKTIGAVENAFKEAFPDFDIRRAFTSRIIRKKLKERDEIHVDDVDAALLRLKKEGYKEVLIQPTYMIKGIEYEEMLAVAMGYKPDFERFFVGASALDREEDFKEITDVLKKETAVYNKADTAIVFMGHGSEHQANEVYHRMDEYFKAAGLENYFLGTVEAVPALSAVMDAVRQRAVKRVVLLPFMVVAGDHANHDMAGRGADSWKSSFAAAGYEVECVMKGLGEYRGIQQLFVRHGKEALL